MSSKIVAIEGICCSGKTTLINALSTSSEYHIVEEYGTYTSRFPALAKTSQDLEDSLAFFQQLENLRHGYALGAIYSGKTIVLDRSFLTCCAYDFALCKNTPLEPEIERMEKSWGFFKKKLIPDTIVVLYVNDAGFNSRLRKSGKKLNPPLDNRHFNANIYKYFSKLRDTSAYDVVWVDTSSMNAKQVEQHVREVLART